MGVAVVTDPVWPTIVKFVVVVFVATFWILLGIYIWTWFMWRLL